LRSPMGGASVSLKGDFSDFPLTQPDSKNIKKYNRQV